MNFCQICPLTDSADNFTGTANNDTFTGTLPFTSANPGVLDSTATLTPGDQLNGGAGTDTLNITISGAPTGATTYTANPNLTGVEKVLVSNVASANLTVAVDMSLADSAVTTIGTSSSTTAGINTQFTNVASLIDVEMAGKGGLEINHATAAVTSGITDAINVTLKGAGTSSSARSTLDFTDEGIETVNVTGSTAANYVTLNNDGIETLNVSGDKSVYISVNQTVTEINTSTATAAVSVEIESGVADLSAVTVTGGAATTDTLILNDDIAAATDLENVSGVEVLGLNKTNGTIDLAAAVTGVSTFDLSNINKQTLTLSTGYTGDTTVKIGVSSTGGAGNSDDVVTNSANVNLTVSGNVANFNTAAITGGSGTDTMNMSADGGAADLSGLSAGSTTLIDAINILASTSNPALGATLTAYTNASGKTTTVDASALTNSSAVLSFTVGTNNAGNLNVTGGAGNDIVDLSTGTFAGKATVSGGAGNDGITVDAGSHSIDGGAGNDTITVSGAMSSSLTISGGDGTDSLVVDSLSGTTPLANVTNIENIAFSENATSISLASSLGAGLTIDLSKGTANTTAQSLTLASGYTGDTTVKVGTTVDSVTNSANVALTVSGTTVASFNSAAIAGGTGTDTLTMKANDDAAALGSVTGVETITITANTTDATKNATLTAVTAAANKTLTVDASALTSSTADFSITAGDSAGSLSITGGAGNDTINLGSATTGTAVTHYVSAGAGIDNITGSGGKDSIDAGAGNDIITMNGNLDFNDTINGGDGTDTVIITASASGMLAHITNVEVLKVSTTTAIDFGSDAVGFNTFDLSDATNADIEFVAGFTGDTTVKLSTDTGDAITNTANIALTVTGNVASFDGAIVGGTGSDTLKMTANNDTVTLSTSTSKIDNITILANSTASKTAGVTLGANQVVATGGTLVVDATNLTDSAAAFTFDGSGNTGTGKMSITGGAGSDDLTGDANADTIDGGAGNDYIDGTTGLDQITTGTGYDVVNVVSNANALTYATITDFSTGDTLVLATDTAPASAAPTELTLGAGATSLSDYVNAALTGDGSTTSILQWFRFGGNTYVVVDNGATGSYTTASGGNEYDKDAVVCLTGDIDLSASTVRTSGNSTYWQLGATATALAAPGTTSVAFSFVGTSGADNFQGTANADTFTFAAANLGSSDTVAGAGGTDKIVISDASATAAVDADFTKATSIEQLQLTAASTAVVGTIAQAAGLTTVITGTGNTTVTSTMATSLAVSATTLNGTLTTGAATGNYTVSAGATATGITATGSSGTLAIEYADLTGDASTVAAGSGNVTVVGGAAGDTITVTGLATASQTFTGTVAKFDVTAGAGAQTITTGAADDTINGGAGDDIIVLSSGGADTVEWTAAADGVDQITGFTIGNGAGKDQLDLTFAGLEALGVDLVDFDTATSATNAADTPVLQVITAATTLGTVANADVLVVDGNVASASDLETALEATGDFALTLAADGAMAIGDVFLVAYDSGAHSWIAAVTVGGDGAANGETFATGELTVTNLVQLTGVTNIATLHADNIDWV